MKKNLLYVTFVLTLCVVAVLNVKVVQTANKSYDLSMASIEAISNGDNGENGDGETGGANITSSEKCHEQGGYWNMALTCAGGGVESVSCGVTGEISLFGVTVKGSYTKGKAYPIAWERWSCVTSTENCCVSSGQGVKIKS